MSVFPPKRILVPTDLSDASTAALRTAQTFAEKLGSEIIVLHAERVEVPPYFTRSQIDALKAERESVRKRAVEHVGEESAKLLGSKPEVVVVSSSPTIAIMKAIEERDIDLVIMGTHGKSGAERFWLGSVTERVLRSSPRPVLAVHRASKASGFEKILCSVKIDPHAPEVLKYAVWIAESFDAGLDVIYSAGDEALPPSCPGVSDALRKHCTIEEIVLRGDPAANIVKQARERKSDIIVMGAKRKTGGWGEIFSTTTERVMRGLETSLLVIPKLENGG